MTDKFCSSCNVNIGNIGGSVVFMCPACGEVEIVRCRHCRKIGARYKCKKCGLEGPN